MKPNFLRMLVPFAFLCLAAPVQAQNDAFQQLMKAGETALQQGKPTEAEQSFRGALAAAAAFNEKDPRIAGVFIKLAEVTDALKRPDEAETLARQALKALDKARTVRAKDESEASVRDLISAQVWETAARIFKRHQKYADAEPLFKSVISVREKALFVNSDPQDNSDWIRMVPAMLTGETENLAASYMELGGLYFLLGKYKDAEKTYKKGIEFSEERLGGPGPLAAANLTGLATVYAAQGKNREAEDSFRRAITIFRKSEANFPFASALESYSAFLRKSGRNDEAASMDSEAKDVRISAARNELFNGLRQSGETAKRRKEFPEAEQFLRQAVNAATVFKETDPRMALVLIQLAEVTDFLKKRDEAEILARQAVNALEKARGSRWKGDENDVEKDLSSARIWGTAGLIFKRHQKYSEAESLFKTVLLIWDKKLSENNLPKDNLDLNGLVLALSNDDVWAAYTELAGLYFLQGKYADAEKIYQQSYKLSEKSFPPQAAVSLGGLATVYAVQGKNSEADSAFRKAVALFRNFQNPSALAVTLENFSVFLKKTGRAAEAASIAQEASEIRNSLSSKPSPRRLIPETATIQTGK